MKTNLFYAAALAAISLFAFSCSETATGGGGQLYCNYGTSCDAIATVAECDTQAGGQLTNTCGNTPQQNGSSSDSNEPIINHGSSSSAGGSPAKQYCDFGPEHVFGGGCVEIESASDCDTRWGVVAQSCGRQDKKFCDFGAPSSFGGGGCYETPATCTTGGSLVYSCPATSLKVYCYHLDAYCERIGGNCSDMENLPDCNHYSGTLVTRSQCASLGVEPDDCND